MKFRHDAIYKHKPTDLTCFVLKESTPKHVSIYVLEWDTESDAFIANLIFSRKAKDKEKSKLLKWRLTK